MGRKFPNPTALQDGSRSLIKKKLEDNRFLSPSFRGWYLSIFCDLSKNFRFPPKKIIESIEQSNHPHEAINLLRSSDKRNVLSRYKVEFHEKLSSCRQNDVVKSNDQELLDFFQALPAKTFADYYQNLSPVSSGSMFLDSGTSPRLIFTKSGRAFVVVNVSSQEKYLRNYYLIKRLLQQPCLSKMKIKTIEKIGVISSKGHQFFMSEYMGNDYEAEIIENGKIAFAKDLLRLSKELESCFRKSNLFVRNLAPRNLLRGGNGANYLIDFDSIFFITKNRKMALFTKELMRKAWYADIFDERKINRIFSTAVSDPEDLRIKADRFERKFFGKQIISSEEAIKLYRLVKDFEHKDDIEGVTVYGHQLGRFISDFWVEDLEVLLYKYINLNRRVGSLRVILYLLSRLDQELLLRQKYDLNPNTKLFSALCFKNVTRGKALPHNSDLKKIIFSGQSFNERSILLRKLL